MRTEALKRATIFGAGGQDGSFLAELLAQKGYELQALGSQNGPPLEDPRAVAEELDGFQPDEIYYLAAYHHSAEQSTGVASELWRRSIEVNQYGLVSVLEWMRSKLGKDIRLFFASSSLVFGDQAGVLNEESRMLPNCAYGITKLAGMGICRHYRQHHDLHASVGILFNHESERRKPHFLARKISRAAHAIKNGVQTHLTLGSLENQVDWGFAGDYVKAMYLINQLPIEDSGEFVIATGKLHTVADFARIAFSELGLDADRYLRNDPSILQRRHFPKSGDFSKLQRLTGWSPTTMFDSTVRRIVQFEGRLS